MPDSGIVKYHVRLKYEIEGVVEKADIIGAIFGQTEGLFGPEMNLNELQKTWKVGRIEINLQSKNDRTYGEVLIPMATDVSTAALIAAAIESVDKVGPCAAHFELASIDDVRAVKRKAIIERAKSIIKDWASKTASEGEEVLKDVMESVKRAKVTAYGREELPAGPGVYTADTVYLVEGRADVINLLRAGIENVVALEGTKVPDSIARLSKEKKLIAFLDGDRAGDLILKELNQVARIHKVIRAPRRKEVEDLTPVEIQEILRRESDLEAKEELKYEVAEPLASKIRELYPKINGTLEALMLDEDLNEESRVPVSELVQKLGSSKNVRHIIFDGIITQRLVDVCSRAGIVSVTGHRTGELTRKPSDLKTLTFRELGLE